MTDAGAGALPTPPTRWQRNAVFGLIGSTIVAGWVGDAVWASLIDRHPLALIMLNAKPRYLVLTVNLLDPWTYYVLGTARLLCTKPLVWMVGRWYGHRSVDWLERRSRRGASLLQWTERHFGRWGWAVILITSSNPVCLLAGSAGFPLAGFMVLAVIGTLVRLWIFAQVGDVFSDPIADIIELVVANRAAVAVASVSVLAIGLWLQHRSGGSRLEHLAALEQAMTEEPADGSPEG